MSLDSCSDLSLIRTTELGLLGDFLVKNCFLQPISV